MKRTDHRMVRQAVRYFDGATRMFRACPTPESHALVILSAEALAYADRELIHGPRLPVREAITYTMLGNVYSELCRISALRGLPEPKR